MKNMTNDYYTLDNGKSAIDYIYQAHLEFAYGNSFKYLVRCGRKENNSAESDLNKALTYVLSADNEMSFAHRMLRKIYNMFTFNFDTQMCEHHLASILKSIIRFERPTKVAKKIVKYAKWRGINVKPEFEKYGE